MCASVKRCAFFSWSILHCCCGRQQKRNTIISKIHLCSPQQQQRACLFRTAFHWMVFGVVAHRACAHRKQLLCVLYMHCDAVMKWHFIDMATDESNCSWTNVDVSATAAIAYMQPTKQHPRNKWCSAKMNKENSQRTQMPKDGREMCVKITFRFAVCTVSYIIHVHCTYHMLCYSQRILPSGYSVFRVCMCFVFSLRASYSRLIFAPPTRRPLKNSMPRIEKRRHKSKTIPCWSIQQINIKMNKRPAIWLKQRLSTKDDTGRHHIWLFLFYCHFNTIALCYCSMILIS